jgi:hypothetical protein
VKISCTKGRNQKKLLCKGRIKRKKITGEKTKLAHITGVLTYLPLIYYSIREILVAEIERKPPIYKSFDVPIQITRSLI